MALIGYARVSTGDQRVDLQHDALNEAGCSRIYTDQGVSGTKASRPELDRCLDRLEPGDTLVVWRLDRLGRGGSKTALLIEELNERGVKFRSLTEGIDTTGAMGKCMMRVIAAFAAMERDVIVERTKAGLAAAKARGNLGGRPAALSEAKIQKARKLRASGDFSVQEIASMLNVSKATIYRVTAPEALAAH